MYDVIIIGAGVSGLMSACFVNKDKKILVIEKNDKPGKKLLLTGNGRCNLTNLKSNKDFLDNISYNKKYLYSTIYGFGPSEIYDYFTSNNVPLKEEKDNQIFPISNKSSDILNVLISNSNHVTFNYNEEVLNINTSQVIEIVTKKQKYQAKNVIIATGGASFNHTGSSGDHIKFAKMLKQPVIDLFPAETGVVLKENLDLAGTSFEDVNISFDKIKTKGTLMFTHQGLGGTAIMLMSEHIYKSNNKGIKIDFLPNINNEELLSLFDDFDKEKEVTSFLNSFFTKRFSSYIINSLNLDKKIKSITKTEKVLLMSFIKEKKYLVKEVNELQKAYVTGGGISLDYIDSKTMESKINPGIYFTGEALDIHGPIGGYNITLALSTGRLAAVSINKKGELK